jgi:hypothetical protein
VDVTIKGIDHKLGTKGLTLWVSKPSGGQVGRLEFGKAKLRWFKGSSHVNGYEVTLNQFITWLESHDQKRLG